MGMNNREIAKELGVSRNTVSVYLFPLEMKKDMREVTPWKDIAGSTVTRKRTTEEAGKHKECRKGKNVWRKKQSFRGWLMDKEE